MKQSTSAYLVACIVFMCSCLWTAAMVYMHINHGLVIFSIPFVMLSIVPVLGYSLTIWLVMTAHTWKEIERPFKYMD